MLIVQAQEGLGFSCQLVAVAGAQLAFGGALGEILRVLSLLILSTQVIGTLLCWTSGLRFQLSVLFPLSPLAKLSWVDWKVPISYSEVSFYSCAPFLRLGILVGFCLFVCLFLFFSLFYIGILVLVKLC